MSHFGDLAWQQLLTLAGNSTLDPTGEAAWKEISRRLRQLARVAVSQEAGMLEVDADDAVQTLLILLQEPKRRDCLTSLSSPGGYLYVALRNELRQHRRKRKLERRTRPTLEMAVGGVEPEADDRIATLRDALATLNHEQRRLLRMRFWENKSIGNISSELGVSYSAAAVRLHRLLRHLRGLLRDGNRSRPLD